MDAFTFDTLRASKLLKEHGFSGEQAEALAEMQGKAMEAFARSRQLAIRKDIYELRLEMHKVKADLIRWVVALNAALGAFLAGAMALLK